MGLFDNQVATKKDDWKIEPSQEVKVLPKPKICCVDIDSESLEVLINSGYSLYKGTLGGIMKNIPNKRSNDYFHVSVDFDFPANFHEYDILILDLTNESHIEFEPVEIDERQTRSQKIFSLICSYPTRIFDPRPIASSILRKKS